MSKKFLPAIYVTAGLIAGAALFRFFSFNKINEVDEPLEVKKDGRLQYKWYAPEIPNTISFAGEKVPLERWDVREQMEREMLVNYYGHTNTLYILKELTRYFPMIEERLNAN